MVEKCSSSDCKCVLDDYTPVTDRCHTNTVPSWIRVQKRDTVHPPGEEVSSCVDTIGKKVEHPPLKLSSCCTDGLKTQPKFNAY